MSKRCLFCFALLSYLSFQTVHARIHFGSGVAMFDRKVQSNKEADKKQSPPAELFILAGTRFRLFKNILATPELGLQFNREAAEDNYGGKISIKTFLLRYHALYPISAGGFSSSVLSVRFGATTFIRSTKGEGGSLEVPNGSSTMAAYRPSDKTTSYTADPALGFDYMVSRPLLRGTRNFGVGALLEVPQFLSKERRIWGLSFLLSIGL
jgi:hypothetical protein